MDDIELVLYSHVLYIIQERAAKAARESRVLKESKLKAKINKIKTELSHTQTNSNTSGGNEHSLEDDLSVM